MRALDRGGKEWKKKMSLVGCCHRRGKYDLGCVAVSLKDVPEEGSD